MRMSYVIASFALLAAPLQAATIVVSPNGAFQTLQAGIDAAAAGDTVIVKAGTYSGVATIPAAKAGLTLKGSGKVVLDARGAGGAKLGAGIVVAAANVTIRGITVRNAARIANNLGDGIRLAGIGGLVEKCIVRACEDVGVGVIAPDCEVRKCTISVVDRGVFAVGADRTRVSSCSFRAAEVAVLADDSDDVVVEDVRVIDTGSNDVIRSENCARFTLRDLKAQTGGVVADLDGPDITIDGVSARRCGGGIVVSGTSATIRDVVLRDCLDSEAGIRIDASVSTVTHARFTGMTTSAIVVEPTGIGCVIKDCRAIRCGSEEVSAFEIRGEDARLEDCRVEASPSDGFLVAKNDAILVGCRAIRCAFDGFDVEDTANTVTFDDCIAQKCLAEGFDISGVNVFLTDCVAKNNRIDFASDGVLAVAEIAFVTGGANVAPEID